MYISKPDGTPVLRQEVEMSHLQLTIPCKRKLRVFQQSQWVYITLKGSPHAQKLRANTNHNSMVFLKIFCLLLLCLDLFFFLFGFTGLLLYIMIFNFVFLQVLLCIYVSLCEYILLMFFLCFLVFVCFLILACFICLFCKTWSWMGREDGRF